jgi:hypothetical protein
MVATATGIAEAVGATAAGVAVADAPVRVLTAKRSVPTKKSRLSARIVTDR